MAVLCLQFLEEKLFLIKKIKQNFILGFSLHFFLKQLLCRLSFAVKHPHSCTEILMKIIEALGSMYLIIVFSRILILISPSVTEDAEHFS